MQRDPEQIAHAEFAERLHAIVDEMLRPFGKASLRDQSTFLNPNPLPFDVSKDNEHDTKAEFAAELKVVESCVNDLKAVLMRLRPSGEGTLDDKVRDGLRRAVNEQMKKNAPGVSAQDAFGLIRRNAAEVNGFFSSLLILLDLMSAFEARLERLREQQALYWTLRNRAPDYYARAIALRLARLYAHRTGQRPTVGTTAELGDPSTGFTRALQEVFNLLGISTGVRSPAAWAVDQIGESDLRPPVNYLASLLTAPFGEVRQPGLMGDILGLARDESPDPSGLSAPSIWLLRAERNRAN